VEQDGVADEVALVVDRDELLGPVDGEVLEAVHAGVAQELQRIGAGDEQVGHVVGLVEQGDGVAPRALLRAPVRELGRHGEDRGPRLRVAQQLDGGAGAVDGFGDGFGHGNSVVRGGARTRVHERW
jgi:hypothetical protein